MEPIVADDLVGMDPGLDAAAAIRELAAAIEPGKWEGTLGELLAATIHALTPELGAELAEQLAPQVVVSQADYVGGGSLYFPKADELRRALRDAQMAARYFDQGWSIERLRKHHHLTPQQVYAILARQRAIRRRAEPDLFGFGEGE
jgi:Mor family transcriptional regulator